MVKLIKCKSCGQEIAKTAKTCPHCGAKNKKPSIVGIILLVLGIILIISALGGGNDDEPQKVGSNNSDTTAGQSNEPQKFTVGDKVKLGDVVVTLVNVSESSGKDYTKPTDGNVFVLCEFEIENNSDKDIVVSSIMSFETYIDNYTTNQSLSALLCTDKTQLDGTVAAGKKMNGVIGYEASQDWNEVEIRFTPDFWAGKDIIFTYSK